jgi:hypothetical protein
MWTVLQNSLKFLKYPKTSSLITNPQAFRLRVRSRCRRRINIILLKHVLMDHGSEAMLGTVKNRKRDSEGYPVGRSNMNPLLDTREYAVEFPDGLIDVLTANAIAELLYSQVNEEGRSYVH